MTEDECVMRRVHCTCDGMLKGMYRDSATFKRMETEEREQYISNMVCDIQDIVGDLNDWKVVKVGMKLTMNKETKQWETNPVMVPGVNKIFQDTLTIRSGQVLQEIEVGNFAAIASANPLVEEGFWLVELKQKLYPLYNPAIVFGCNNEEFEMPIGTMVVDGVFHERIGYAPRWFQPQEVA